jgi:hypothetical protein
LAPDLELAGLLVAEHRQLQDVWLRWQVKEINFDTALGYRTYYLLTAGVAATVAAVQASDPARLGERDSSRRIILQWADTQPLTTHTLHSVQFHLAGLGFLDEAIQFQVEAVAITEPGSGKASALLGLIKLHRQAGQFADARQALRDCAEVMPRDDYWRQAGLWRYFVKEHFLLVPMAPDRPAAQRLVQEGDHQMRGIRRLWMDGVLDAAIEAAEHTGQHHLRDHYLQVQADEQRARDEEIRQASTRRGPTTPAPSSRS